ncbi:outer membrane protein assembly factor BamB [Candidatus Sororendozoicomonas aggregata]|uniref:outer membrane protein assembly factor BamB n=1 Tax=Candidatus Sororendozoicomonas aggregata TaxID=3073239 RepID=UPI002ED1A9C4
MERCFRALAVVLLVSGLSACSLFSSEEEVVKTPKALKPLQGEVVTLTKVWSKSLGDKAEEGHGNLRPTIEGDAIYAVGAAGTVIAVDRKTGKDIWRRKLENIRVSGGLTVRGGRVLLGTLNGDVIALSQKDGSELWRARVSSEVLSAPASDGFTVLVKSIDDKLTALDAENGKVLWTQSALQPALTLRGASAPVIEGEAALAGYAGGEVKAFRLESGVPLWEARVATPKGSSELERMVDIDTTPLIVGDTMFVASYQGNVAALDLYRGRLKWSKEMSSYRSLAEGFGSLYVTDQDSYVSSLDQRTGASSWQQKDLEYRDLSAPATFGNYVVVGDYEGYIHLLSQVDGSMVGRYHVGSSAIEAQPVVDGDRVYIQTVNGKLVALSMKKQ